MTRVTGGCDRWDTGLCCPPAAQVPRVVSPVFLHLWLHLKPLPLLLKAFQLLHWCLLPLCRESFLLSRPVGPPLVPGLQSVRRPGSPSAPSFPLALFPVAFQSFKRSL